MINLTIYRASLAPIAVVFVLAMFSLKSVPEPLQAPIAPDSFDGDRAAGITRELTERFPEPRPGSEADQDLAAYVADRFQAIDGAEVAEQEFKGSFDGEDVDLRNVIAVLPGQSDRQIAVLAQRDATRGSGAASSLASTAALLEIASGFGGSTHAKTLVFISTDGDGLAADGAVRFAEDYTEIDLVDSVVVISQPAAAEPQRPLLIPWSSGPESTAIELTETTAEAIKQEAGISPGETGVFSDIFRLAIPATLGAQGPLIERGIDAIRISSSGERAIAPSEDEGVDDVSAPTLDRIGRAALAVMLALDDAPSEPLEHGPATYIGLGDNLLPGWTLSLLALALILPVGLTALDAFVRAVQREPDAILQAIGWILTRAVPFLAALLLAYVLAVPGLLPSPDFPFDPGRFEVGTGSKIALVLIFAAWIAAIVWVKPLRPPPPDSGEAPVPTVLVLITLAVLAVWLANPYLGLVLAPALHLWMLAAMPGTRLPAVLSGLILIAGLLPLIIAIGHLASRLEVGTGVGWQLLLLITDGQIGFLTSVALCVLAGSGLSIAAMTRARVAPSPPEIKIRKPA